LNILDLLSKHPWFLIEVRYSLLDKLSIDETKLLIKELVLENKWYRQSGESKEEFCDWFDGVSTYHELMRSISLYGGLVANAGVGCGARPAAD